MKLIKIAYHRALAAMLIAGVAIASVAQTSLTKEITVEKDFSPTERKATKKDVLPTLLKRTADPTAPRFSEVSDPVEMPVQLMPLPALGYRTDKQFSAYRGYASLAAGSNMNIDANVGYRLISSPYHTLAVWMQHTSTWLGRNASPNAVSTSEFTPLRQRYCDNVIGAEFDKDFSGGTLKLAASLRLDFFNYYAAPSAEWDAAHDNQQLADFLVSGSWNGTYNHQSRFRYKIDMLVGHTGMKKGIFADLKPMSQTVAGFKFGGEYGITDITFAGVDLGLDFLSNTHVADFDFGTLEQPIEQYSRRLGMFTLNPHLLFLRNNLMLRIGATINASWSDGATLRFAPDIEARYKVSSGMGLYLKTGGGKSLTTLQKMLAENRYINPHIALPNPYVPVDAEVGVSVGPYKGCHLTLFGGYTKVCNAPLPFLSVGSTGPNVTIDHADMIATTFLEGMDVGGWKAGAELGVAFTHYVEAKGRFTYAPQDNEDGVILGIDRPKYLLDASLKISPIERLDITAGYQWRGSRGIYSRVPAGEGESPAYYYDVNKSLGDVCDLKVRAAYRLTDAITVYAQGSNLLNRQYDVLYGAGAQRLTVMGGVSLKF